MKATATFMALLALALLPGGPSSAQTQDGRDVATVIRLYVEQAPGVLADVQLAHGRGVPQWAEIRREKAQGNISSEMVRLPAGVSLRTGDRVLVAGAKAGGSASIGSSAPPRLPLDTPLERMVDLSTARFAARPGDLWAARAAAAPPLSVVPGSCIPF